jgi:hypothetical protein
MKNTKLLAQFCKIKNPAKAGFIFHFSLALGKLNLYNTFRLISHKSVLLSHGLSAK